MLLRETLNRKPMAAVGVIVVVAAAAMVRIMTAGSAGPVVDERYFYDVSSGKLITGDRLALPPIEMKTGEGTAVGAVVFSCGDCADESSRFIGWLETYTPDAKRLMEQMSADNPMTEREDAIVLAGFQMAQLPEGGGDLQWVPVNSDVGETLQLEVINQCDGKKRANACLPK